MKLYLDTANVEEIRELAWLIDGVTTNPTLVAREGRPFHEVLREICALVRGPVSAEVLALDEDGMVREARELAALAPNVVVKIPMTEAGLKAVQALTREGIRTNVTLVFSANQALLAAKAGASYVSPFVGRIDDAGGTGWPSWRRSSLSTKTTASPPRSSWRASATRGTSSRRPSSGPPSPPSPTPS